MKKRCDNPKWAMWKYYWWRWITYDLKWKSWSWFEEDMLGSYVDGLQIDRIDSNWNYCKENCRWVTPKQNSNNTRRNITIEYNGEIKSITERSEKLKINYWKLLARVKKGMSFEDAIKDNSYKKVMFTHNGKTQSITDWYKELWISRWVFEYRRYSKKMNIKESLNLM